MMLCVRPLWWRPTAAAIRYETTSRSRAVLDVVDVAAGGKHLQRQPTAVADQMVLAARAGAGPTRAPPCWPAGGLRQRPPETRRSHRRVQLGQQDPVELVEACGLGPAAQPPPAGHLRAEPQLLGEVLPADAGVQHDQDRLQAPPAIDRPRPWRSDRPGRQQRRDQLPQPTVDDPRRCHAGPNPLTRQLVTAASTASQDRVRSS